MQETSDSAYVCFPTIGCHGRLGNALFQYAAGKALATFHNVPFKVPRDIFTRCHHSQQCLLHHFDIEFDYEGESATRNNIQFQESVSPYTFMPEFFELPANTDLYGHFENEQYFESISSTIKQEYQHKPYLKQFANTSLDSIRHKYGEDYKVVALHMRRGDTINLTSEQVLNDLSENGWLHRFIKESLGVIDASCDRYVVLVFTGGSRDGQNSDDIEWCSQNIPRAFPNHTFVFNEAPRSCIEDHALLTQCDHVICTNVSTFAWWAGYLNPHDDACIIVPSHVPFNPFYSYGPQLDLRNFWARRFKQLNVPFS